MLDDPAIIESENVLDKLRGTTWIIVGPELYMPLTFTELMAVVYYCVQRASILEEAFKEIKPGQHATVGMKIQPPTEAILTPENTRASLKKRIELKMTPPPASPFGASRNWTQADC